MSDRDQAEQYVKELTIFQWPIDIAIAQRERVIALERALREIEQLADSIPTANSAAFNIACDIAGAARAALEGK